MGNKIQVVIAGRDKDFLEHLAPITREYFGCDPVLQHISNGHADPLHGHTDDIDLLIVDLAADWREQLGSICARPAAARPPMLVVGPATEVEAMRLAMRAGARDYLSTPVNTTEFLQALSLIEQEERRHDHGPSQWTSIIGAKGGIGASMIACNLAQLVCQANKHTALLDINLQAGSLVSYLDLEPRNDFQDAIEGAPDLDSVALEGFMTKTADGLHLLAAPTSQIILPDQIPSDNLTTLFDLIATNYEHVIVDLPRNLDHVVAAAVEQSDHVFLVMEQSVVAMRETLRILDVLCREFGLSESQIRIIINRYSKSADVTEGQIRKNIGDLDIHTIPNDFRIVRESLDIGIPVVRHARGSASAKALTKLSQELTGQKSGRGSLVSSLTSILRS
ncbi:MAG: AAA family ATPase [Gammaproteobacteria bacterium]|nr:AAA family ATPase [Gammaproteobacteria bacterium]